MERGRSVGNLWVLGVDSEDRDGLYLGYNLKPIEVGKQGNRNLQPQFTVRRALDGKPSSYVLPGTSVGSEPQSQPARIGDPVGPLGQFDSRVLGLKASSYTHPPAHETVRDRACSLPLA